MEVHLFNNEKTEIKKIDFESKEIISKDNNLINIQDIKYYIVTSYDK